MKQICENCVLFMRDDCPLNFEMFESCLSSLITNIRCKLMEKQQ